MKTKRGLIIKNIVKMSHVDARVQSFRISVAACKAEEAKNAEIWPYGVRVRVFRHKRQEGFRGNNLQRGAGLEN